MGNTETDGPRRRRPSMLINKRRTGWKKREAAKAEVELRGGGRWDVRKRRRIHVHDTVNQVGPGLVVHSVLS